MRLYRIYVAVSLFVIMALLTVLVVSVLYAGQKIRHESSSVSSKVDNFSHSLDTLNQNLKNISTQLQTETANLSRSPTSGL